MKLNKKKIERAKENFTICENDHSLRINVTHSNSRTPKFLLFGSENISTTNSSQKGKGPQENIHEDQKNKG